jgi:hypothetical protein
MTSSAPFSYMNGTLVGSDLGQILVYANSITSGLTAPLMILSFFLLVLLSSMMWSYKISGRIKPEIHFAAASFATLGFVTLLSTINGLVLPVYFVLCIAAAIGSALWIFLSNPNENY